jgi:hypothetical protein
VTSERQSHAARPTDLVALVSFDDQVRQNQAVTLDGLADPDQQKTRPLSVALAQWLHLGRRMWINVDGREVRGIATARDLSARSAWVIDTLIDAAGEDDSDEVLADLLGQSVEAAARAEVTHVLLRTQLDAPGREAATRAGFRPALVERLWRGRPEHRVAAESSPHPVDVRTIDSADDLGLFQLYCRALPVEARALLGMTREEWSSVRDRKWLRGGSELVAWRDGVISGLAGFSDQHGRVQLDVLAAADDRASVDALVAAVVERTNAQEIQSLVPRCSGSVEGALSDAGLRPDGEYIQLCRRMARPVLADAPIRAGLPIPTGGGA